MKKDNKRGYLYGTATIGEKGQVVIPVEARGKLKLNKGEKLLVIRGDDDDTLILIKPSRIKDVVEELSTLLKSSQ